MWLRRLKYAGQREVRLRLSDTCPEREHSSEDGSSFVRQAARVTAETFGGLVAGEGDLSCEDGDGLVAPAVDEKVAQFVGDLLHLHGVTVAQLRMLFNELVVAGVGLGVGGCLGAEGENDRAELFDSHGRVLRGSRVDCLTGRGDRLEQFLLLGENDLLVVTKVAEERGAADFGALGDVADRDVVEAAREEELLGGLDDRSVLGRLRS
jgi:hypothetical protein